MTEPKPDQVPLDSEVLYRAVQKWAAQDLKRGYGAKHQRIRRLLRKRLGI